MEYLSRSAGLILAFLLAVGLGSATSVAAGWTQGRSEDHFENAASHEGAKQVSSASHVKPERHKLEKFEIALSFDDGPDPKTTPEVLDVLKRYDVKATFFVRGDQTRAYPRLVRREYREGHVVGNHSYSHPPLTTLTKTEVERQLRDTNAAIAAAGAPKPKLFRPPWGETDADVQSAANSLGLTQTLWDESASTEVGGGESATPAAVCEQVVAGAEPRAILLLHAAFTPSTAEALPCILRRLKAQGYEFGLIYPSSTYDLLNRSYVQIK